MLELSNEAPIGRSQRPSVRIVNDMVRRHGQKGLNGEHQSFMKNHLLSIVDARHRWRLVEPAPDAVPVEILDDAKTMAASSPLDRSAQIAEPGSGLSGVHCINLSELSRPEKPRGNRRHHTYRDADASVREVAVQFGRHVEVDDVTLAQLPLEGGNAMGGFVVDTDTCGPREPVGHPWRRASSIPTEYVSSHRVEFSGGRTRRDGLHHCSAGFGDNATGAKERLEVFLPINGHAAILRLEASVHCSAPGQFCVLRVRATVAKSTPEQS